MYLHSDFALSKINFHKVYTKKGHDGEIVGFTCIVHQAHANALKEHFTQK